MAGALSLDGGHIYNTVYIIIYIIYNIYNIYLYVSLWFLGGWMGLDGQFEFGADGRLDDIG